MLALKTITVSLYFYFNNGFRINNSTAKTTSALIAFLLFQLLVLIPKIRAPFSHWLYCTEQFREKTTIFMNKLIHFITFYKRERNTGRNNTCCS